MISLLSSFNWTLTSVKPAASNIGCTSSTAGAPATQQANDSSVNRDLGSSLVMTTSDTAILPPGFSTRNIYDKPYNNAEAIKSKKIEKKHRGDG